LNYVLYPLLPGDSVLLPQLKLSSVRLTLTEDLSSTLQRLLPRSITVLPKARSKNANNLETDKEKTNEKDVKSSQFIANEPIFISSKLMARKGK